MGNSLTPLKSSQSRVFLIRSRARGDHVPEYQSCLRAGGLSWGLGDIEKIECPSDDAYDKYDEVGQVKGATDRATTTLEGRYALDLKSTLLELARQRCAVDVQVHLGECTDPREFSKFKKNLILENAFLTNYSTEDLGSLASGDNAAVNESVDISAKDAYEVVPLSFAEKAGSIVTNEVIDVVICDTLSCGDCEDSSDGCQKIFALTKAAGGSPSTMADIVFSIDKGVTWYAHDVDSLLAAEEPTALACVGSYIVVVSADSCSLHYADKDDFDGVTDPAFAEVGTGFVAGGCPYAIKSVGSSAFIVGNGGYIYFTDDPTAGVEVLDAGVATAARLLAVDALSETFAVAVGQHSAIVKTENGTTWELVTPPTGIGVNYNCVAVKSSTEWWIGTSTGILYSTFDGGKTWNIQAFPGSGTGAVEDIVFATDTIAYLSHQTAATKGRILRSFDGGREWVVLPESGATLPVNDSINALAACEYDPNFVVGVGLADNNTDGIILVGEGA